VVQDFHQHYQIQIGCGNWIFTAIKQKTPKLSPCRFPDSGEQVILLDHFFASEVNWAYTAGWWSGLGWVHGVEVETVGHF